MGMSVPTCACVRVRLCAQRRERRPCSYGAECPGGGLSVWKGGESRSFLGG